MIRESELSPTMAEALRVAVMHDGLVRWSGVVWTYQGCPTSDRESFPGIIAPFPDWHITVYTLKALARRGLIEFPNFKTARLTDAGRDAV